MATTYSTYEAKARFSELLRQVREDGETITVTYRGEPVAEVRPIPPKPQTIEERFQELRREGIRVPPKGPKQPFRPVVQVPGALQRFLDDRNE